MCDLAEFVAVLGALDREVARLEGDERATAQRRIAALIPPYGAPGAVGWYDEWVGASGSDAPTEDLDRAILDLARPTGDRYVAARRLPVIAAAVQALPERYGPTGARRDVALHALTGPGILASAPGCGEEPIDGASSGTSRLADEAERCLSALADGELESTVALRAVIEPCARFDLPRVLPSCRGKLVDTRLGGDVDPTPALTVRLRVEGITLGQASETFLDPSHWKRASGWCDMVAAPLDQTPTSGSRRFLEVVSTSCEPGVVPAFEFRVWLDFSDAVPVGSGGLVLTYRMSPPDVQSDLLVDGEGANGFLAIDEGSLAVFDKETHLEVTTTKRLRYASEATGRAGLILACGAGFAEMGARFIEQVSDGHARAEELN